MSVSTENFIKTMFSQTQITKPDTRPGTLAKILNISNAAATDMARKLSTKGLVNYTKYKELSLTPKGEQMAVSIIRKHRIWETFLHKTLKLSLHEIHREAEILEHLTSDFLIDKIYEFLEKPTVDPHGDPIPDKLGVIDASNGSQPLTLAKPNHSYEINRLIGSNKEFFDFCHSHHLIIGATIEVKNQHKSNNMTEIKVEETKMLLNEEFTSTIFVTPLKSNK
ncbi:metal-dependent transcriptional regulator [Geofilum sp. OHC36d9]|uniref:metal-dependent transcriptional regulator n=1 Tax=Geofilum sp. OHC36d9 TaxID=3458413 RepID=UPI00403324E1